MSIVQRLTENIVERDLKKEGAALLNKWERTGLLEGIDNENKRNSMARLLENQAKELLRESSTMSGGDVEGFAAVAFPIVRRVFGGLIANDLVSVQPMSLPSGLIFFLDFTISNDSRAGFTVGESVYGGGKVGKEIATGISLSSTNAEKSFYALNNSFSNATGSVSNATFSVANVASVGSLDGTKTVAQVRALLQAGSISNVFDRTVAAATVYDPDLDESSFFKIVTAATSSLTDDANGLVFDDNNLVSIVTSTTVGSAVGAGGTLATSAGNVPGTQIRRLTRLHGASNANVALVYTASTAFTAAGANLAVDVSFAAKDDFDAGSAIGSVIGDLLPLEGAGKSTAAADQDVNPEADVMREIDIKVDSIAVTAQTRKLKAKWSPELGQDLNAYHNLDAEVELTSILSEHIALEIDREILEDLIKGATAGTFHWSRAPGLFLHKTTGKELGASAAAPDFTGNVSMWYETLLETINDVSAQIHRKTLRGGANFVVCSPEVANIMEFTGGFKASVTADADRGTIGAVKVGSLSQKFEVYVDPYFTRNVILVGRKGSSFLESGYVYAPYVPLQVTPTIFGTEDFVPRKGVMTRYAKKMVRPDMYGLVIVHDLLGGEGS